jgi:hypothetical protein
MGGQQKDFISDIVFFQHQDGMCLKVRRHFLQCGGKYSIGDNNAGGRLPPFNRIGGKFGTGVNVTGGKQWEQLV